MNQSLQHLIKLLEARGLLLKRITCIHHIFFHPVERKPIVVPVHGKKDITNGTFLSIIKQAGISKEEI
ncbi:MAG: type II toxin-antitoxin system HicA family toxin [Rhizobacter sp.]|nr:type II toxin-antitoxin system HicA family toxin [Ferruginibacter sp.]